MLGAESGAAQAEDCRIALVLRALGATVQERELFTPPDEVVALQPRAVFVDGGGRLDYALAVGRALRNADPALGVILAVHERSLGSVDPRMPFHDFVVAPYLPAEVVARLRRVEWLTSEFVSEEHLKLGELYVDAAAHEVWCKGSRVSLTQKEYRLLTFLLGNHGKVHSRERLLRAVWGSKYDGGVRTVDVHVRRLRAKLKDTLSLVTVRGAGYKVKSPTESVGARLAERVGAKES